MYLVNIQDAISTTVIWIVDSRVYRDLPYLVYAKKTSLQGLKVLSMSIFSFLFSSSCLLFSSLFYTFPF